MVVARPEPCEQHPARWLSLWLSPGLTPLLLVSPASLFLSFCHSELGAEQHKEVVCSIVACVKDSVKGDGQQREGLTILVTWSKITLILTLISEVAKLR